MVLGEEEDAMMKLMGFSNFDSTKYMLYSDLLYIGFGMDG